MYNFFFFLVYWCIFLRTASMILFDSPKDQIANINALGPVNVASPENLRGA